MGVLMQAFYWDCPGAENCRQAWWNFVRERLPGLHRAGFTALWLPPASKAASPDSMGYDPYDYYDLGEYEQKGSVKTLFGSREELQGLIREASGLKLQVYADLVLNHNNGADEQERNPIDGQMRWTKFLPKSYRFKRDWQCFHPSPYETWDGETFGDMPDLCHRNPEVYTELLTYARWLFEEIGFDGFRYDMVKGYGAWMVRAIQELRLLRDGEALKPFGVGECWDCDRNVKEWLDETNTWSDNPASAFDFALRYRLKELCHDYGYSLRRFAERGTLMWDRPTQAVTFVENHDVARSDPIIKDKMLAYAVILTHEGYPCVFWQDYYNYGLGEIDGMRDIAALVRTHETYAAGNSSILLADDDLYIMQRHGLGAQPGLVFALNTNGGDWRGAWAQTKWKNQAFKLVAAGGRDKAEPKAPTTGGDGWAEFFAPPRGYAVYAPV